MATEAQLKRQISNLRNEIQEIQRKSSDREKMLRKNMIEQMNYFEKQMKINMERRQRETEAEYTNRIRTLQENYAQQTASELQIIKQSSENAIKAQKDKFDQLKKCNEELLALLEKTREQTEIASEAQYQRALQLQQAMTQSRGSADKTPHNFFFEGEFDIIDSRANSIETQMQNKMYQAAAADASAASLQFELLSVRVLQALQEWSDAFNDYRSLIYVIESRITQLEGYVIQTEAGRFNMNPSDLEFWSSETYLAFRKKIKDAMSEIKLIEEKGIVSYLIDCATENRRAVFGKVREARKWNDEFTGIANCILTERVMSDERWMLGVIVKNLLYEMGYNVKARHFRHIEGGKASFPNNINPLDCYDMVFSVQGLDDIFITFCPVRENGVTVHNECLVSANPYTICAPDFVNKVIVEVVDSIKELLDSKNKNVVVIGIPYAENSQQVKAAKETNQKKQPDPRKQLRYIQRKYY